MADAPQNFPPDEWFAAAADGAPQFVACRDTNGETELVEAEWIEVGISEHTLQDLSWLDWPRLARLAPPYGDAFTDSGACEWVFTDTGTQE